MTSPVRSHRLHFSDLGRAITGREDETVFQAARRAGVRIVGACGGRGTCGSCMVRIDQPDGEGGPHHRWRRACRARVRGDCRIEIAPRSLAPVARADVGHDGDGHDLGTTSRIDIKDIAVRQPSLADAAADLDRVATALGRPALTSDLAALRRLPGLLRAHGGRVSARLLGDHIVGFAPPGSVGLGLAVDLGTTNVAAYLVDLATGRRLAALGVENPQSAWGGDLISRINHAIQAPDGAEELRAAIATGLDTLAIDLCHAVGASIENIVDAVICGNTAMHHLLAGLPVHQLGRAPFVAASRAAMDVAAAEIGLGLSPGARAHLVGSIGGFVGGDHVSALLATESRWRGRRCLLMDIGTNTEISLITPKGILSASCPSGPAMEGGHISCGMRAADGAIERVAVVGGRIAVTTIGHKKAIGLCGSGVLDAVAALHGAGLIEHGGRLAAEHPDIGRGESGRFARLAPEVHFTQHDIRAVQLAKAAIRTGADLLLRQSGLGWDDIDGIIIAGAFGSYIHLASAVAIGLLPDLVPERFAQVGNAAGLGVCRMLTSRADLERARTLAEQARYVELSTAPDFQAAFLANIALPRTPRGRIAK